MTTTRDTVGGRRTLRWASTFLSPGGRQGIPVTNPSWPRRAVVGLRPPRRSSVEGGRWKVEGGRWKVEGHPSQDSPSRTSKIRPSRTVTLIRRLLWSAVMIPSRTTRSSPPEAATISRARSSGTPTSMRRLSASNAAGIGGGSRRFTLCSIPAHADDTKHRCGIGRRSQSRSVRSTVARLHGA